MGGNLTLLYAVRRGLSATAPMEWLGLQDALSHLLCVICHKHHKTNEEHLCPCYALSSNREMKWMTASKASRNALIEQKRREGATLAALAAEFSVSPTTISQVLAKIERNRRVIKLRLEAPLRRVTKPYEGE